MSVFSFLHLGTVFYIFPYKHFILKVQLTPQIVFANTNLLIFLIATVKKIIVVAILVNFLQIFKVRKISPFCAHDKAIVNNGASWSVTSLKD